MNTFLSESDQSIRQEFQQFAREQLAPVAVALESRQANLSYFLQKVAKAELFSISVPQEYGGRGGSFLHEILLAEACAAYDPGFALTLAAQSAVIALIKRYGSEGQRSKYLPLLAQGELIGSFAYLEDEAQDVLEGIKTEITGQSTVKYLVGEKKSVVNGRLANLFVVSGLEQIAAGQGFPGLWLVDPGTEHAIEVVEQDPAIGLRSAFLDEVKFNKCTTSPEERLGGAIKLNSREVKALFVQQFEFALSVIKTVLAAAAVGMAEEILLQAANHAKTSVKSGQPISQSQAVQWRLADLAVQSSAGRLLTYRAAWSKEDNQENFAKYAAMCKIFTAKLAKIHSTEVLQIFGAQMNNADSQLARFCRDGQMFELCQGTIDQEKVLLSRELGI